MGWHLSLCIHESPGLVLKLAVLKIQVVSKRMSVYTPWKGSNQPVYCGYVENKAANFLLL